jgi:signal transduction histidine kinase
MLGLQLNKIDLYNNIAAAFKNREALDSATWYAKTVISERSIQNYPAGLLKAATTLSDIYDLEHQPDSTLKYLRMAFNLNDSLFNQEKIIAFKNILFKEQEKQNEVKAVTAALRNRYTLYFLIALFVVLIIIAGIVINNRRIKQLHSIRNSIADDLHDDIGSTLSSISIMNELAKARSPEALPLLTSIGEYTAAIQENMSDIVWTVNPNNDHFENILQRMNLFATEISDAKKIQFEFNSDTSLKTLRLTMKQRKNLYLFFKEAINNAAKHSGAKRIIVHVTKKENNVEMNISDDGSGFNTSTIFSGNGMSSLRKRADELNAVYNITSITDEGTTVQLKFKIT